MGAADGSIFRRQRVRAGNLSVPYLLGGYDGDIEPVVYLHGLGGAGKWEAYHMAMGTVAVTYAPQLPGWRDSRPPAGMGSVQAYAAFMLTFLDALGLDTVTLMGHSIGGWVALHMAVECPDRIARLILADPMGIEVPTAPPVNLATMDEETFATAVFGRLGLIATAQAYGFGAEWENVRQGPEFERQWKGRELVVNLVQGPCSDPELTRRVPSIEAETLLIWGRLDGLVPLSHGEALRAALPRARLEVIDRCGHLPMVEKPETFHRLLRNFLVGVEEAIPDVVTL
jgi:pimeloyl-ACP methyl ester carboxylesterase